MKNAITQLNNKEFKGRNVRVKKAVEKKRLEKKRNKIMKAHEAKEMTVNQRHAMQRLDNKKVKEHVKEKATEKRVEKK